MDEIKKCAVCGAEFKTHRSTQILCGKPECKKARNRSLYTKYEAAPRERVKKYVPSGNQVTIAEENEIARSIGLDYGTYKAYLHTGYLDHYLRIRFHNETAINADGRTVEKSWIGNANGTKGRGLTSNPMQRLTDYECMI